MPYLLQLQCQNPILLGLVITLVSFKLASARSYPRLKLPSDNGILLSLSKKQEWLVGLFHHYEL